MGDDQLSFTTLGGETVTVRKRGKHYIQPRGHVDFPGTGPVGETCGSCQHKVGGRYLKCKLNEARWSAYRGSDILAGSPACRKWEARKP